MKNTITRILFPIALLAILISASACQASPTEMAIPASLSDTPVSVQTLAHTASPTPNADESQAAIVKALLALNTQPNRMESTTLPDGGQVQSNIIEFVPPDRKHIANVEEGVEYIVVGDMVYAKTQAAGQWEETQIPASTFMGEDVVTETALAQTIGEAQFVRRDTLNGRAVLVYSYASTTWSGEIELRSQTELWIGEADGLPYQMIINGEILSASTDPATGESTLQAVQAQTTTLITLDDTISIEPPLP